MEKELLVYLDFRTLLNKQYNEIQNLLCSIEISPELELEKIVRELKDLESHVINCARVANAEIARLRRKIKKNKGA